MTIIEEGRQLRNEIAKLRPDKRRRYGDARRRRILDWVERAMDAGMEEPDCAKALGVKTWRFRTWRQLEARLSKPNATSLALVRIDAPLAMSSAITLVARSGYRVEGLGLEQIAALLRELA
jgi:hypothetical protein